MDMFARECLIGNVRGDMFRWRRVRREAALGTIEPTTAGRRASRSARDVCRDSQARTVRSDDLQCLSGQLA